MEEEGFQVHSVPEASFNVSLEEFAENAPDITNNPDVSILGITSASTNQPPISPSIQTLTEKRVKRQKKKPDDVVRDKLVESLSTVQQAWMSRTASPKQTEPLADAVSAFVKILPDSQPELKVEFCQKIYSLMSEIAGKITAPAV